MRLLTYNVFGLRRGLAAVAANVRACEPDVACLQEVPRFLFWRRTARRLAAEAGLVVVTGGRPAAATMLLARPGLAPRATYDVKLPWHPPRHRRGMAVAVFGDLAVASTHLSLYAAERAEHAVLLRARLDALGVPWVLGGDFNDEPGGPLAEGRAACFPAPTCGARRIDGFYADPGLTLAGCAVPDLPDASDHRPVVVDVL